MRCAIPCLFVALLLGGGAQAQELNSSAPPRPRPITFDPEELIKIPGGDTVTVDWTTTVQDVFDFTVTVSDEVVATVDGGAYFQPVRDGGQIKARGSFNLTADVLGYNTITLKLFDSNNYELASEDLKMSVIISYQAINDIFITSIGVLLALAYVNMGATIDLTIVKQIVFKPIGPLLGIICQFGGMPLIAFGLGMLLFKDQPLYRIGMFMGGCVPGGGASNMWTHLLGGSLDLSIMMTFASTMTAFAALPLWLFTLGPVVSADADFAVPYMRIAIVALSLVIPCAIGLLIQKFLPRVAKVLEVTLSPFSFFIIVYIFTFGLYSNWYIFRVTTIKVWILGFLLPFLGYLLGMSLASMFCLSWRDRIAIGIETGIQNMSIAVFMLNFTLDQPAGNLSVVVPACAVLTSPFPLLLAYAFKMIYGRLKSSQSMDVTKIDASARDQSKKSSSEATANGMEMGEQNGRVPSVANGIDNPAAELSD